MCLFPKREFICLKFHQNINSTTHQILSVGGSLNPYLVWNLDHSLPSISLIYEPGITKRKQYFFYTAISARHFIFSLFESMGVS
jgi:hypothetical protein